MTKREETKSL